MRHLLEEAFNNLMEAKNLEIESLADEVMKDHQRNRHNSSCSAFHPKKYSEGCKAAKEYLTNPGVRKQLPPKFTQDHAIETAKNIINRKKQIDEQLKRWNGQANSSSPHKYTQHIIRHLEAAKSLHEEGNHNSANGAWRTANEYMKGTPPNTVKESQLQEFLGFGAGDHEKEAANHKQKQNAFEDLAHHHQLSGDHEQAKQYKAAALAHGKAKDAYRAAAGESNNSVLKRASSKAKAAAESASNEANSIKTPKPTEAAKRSALTHALRDHDRHGAKFTPRMDDLFNGAKPNEEDYKTHLPKHWN